MSRKVCFLFFILTLFGLLCCTKKLGKNRDLAYSDKAMLDSCLMAAPYYYLNNNTTILSGNNGAHGDYQLRFNAIALNAMTSNGKPPLSILMPEGSLIVKDVFGKSNKIQQYAFMYKKAGNWLWGEITPSREIIFSVNRNPDLCINCHNQSGNQDLILTFKFH